MTNSTTAKTMPENDTQESPMPSEQQQTAQPEDVESAGQVTEEAASTQSDGDALPESASDRTKTEFEKMKARTDEYRRQLQEERERRELIERSFQSMQPKEPEPKETPIYDPETGYINEQVLTDVQKRTLAAEQRAAKAEQAVQQYLHDQENRETFKEYPELDPSNKKSFNKDLHVTTRQILLDSMVNPQDYDNKQLSFREAAALAKTRLPGALESAKKEGAQEAMEQLTPKEQASLEAVGSPSRRGEALADLERLRRLSRRNDAQGTQARIERAKRILDQG